jgi:ferric-dicitrate binding protein FerR (iron transport regulator)
MNNSDRHQPSKQDLDLARRFMNRPESGAPESDPASGDDSLFDLLDSYKQTVSLKKETTASDAVHDAIFESIESNAPKKETSIFTLRSTFLKIAALFLAIAGLGLIYFIMQPLGPQLVAESGSARQVVELFDGSIVTLRPHSQLYEIESTADRQTYRIDGEAFFDVAENQTRLFTAVSGDAKVVVTGTEFSLANWGDAVRVYLESGSVRFSTLDESQSVDLQPGEVSESVDGLISEPSSVSGQVYTGWLDNELRLNSRTLSDVATEIEHHFDVTLIITEAVQNERLTGSLELESLDQVLSDLALSLNGRFIQVDENRYRFEREP